MQMVTGGNTSASSQTDLLTGTDDGSIADAESAEVHIYGLKAVLVINGHIVTGCTAIGSISYARPCRINRPPGSCIQVNTL